MRGEKIQGVLATGIGMGTTFTQLDWVRQQFREHLGIDPYPGTVNLIVETDAAQSSWQRVSATPGIRIDNPGSGPNDCDARCYKALIAGYIEAAIILPEVAGYPDNQIELVAAIAVRPTLGISDGATVVIEIL